MLRSNLCDYSDAYILVKGNITVTAPGVNNNANNTRDKRNRPLILKNNAPFVSCITRINGELIEDANDLDIVIPMYNLLEYSKNYRKTIGSLYNYYRDELSDDTDDNNFDNINVVNSNTFKYKNKITGNTYNVNAGAQGYVVNKRDELPEANAIANLTVDNSNSFKYKVSLLSNPVVAHNIAKRSVKVVVPLKYLSNFFRSLEMPLINCKIKLNLTWKKECVLSTDAGNAVFIINDTKMYVPVVTLSKEDNKDFIEQQNKGFQRSVYWNEYKTKEINENADANVFKYINLDPSFQGVNRLFVTAYNRVDGQPNRDDQRKYYLPKIDLNKYNVIIDGRNFYDNPIESDIEKYRELKKVMIGKGEDYTTGSLLDFDYFKEHYKLVAVDLSKQKELDADPRAIQQIEFKYMLETNSTIYWVLEKSKETILEFYKGTVKVY